MSGLLSTQAFDTELTGDASLSRRPMRRVTQPLASMGAREISRAKFSELLDLHVERPGLSDWRQLA